MPIPARDLKTVRRAVWANLDDYIPVVAGAGTNATTLVGTDPLPGSDGEYIMAGVWVPARLRLARVTASTFSPGLVPTFTLSPAAAGLTVGDEADLHMVYPKKRVDLALIQAHDELVGWAFVEATDTSLIGDSQTSEYPVPTTWVGLHRVEVRLSGHYYTLPPEDWELVRTGAVSTTKLRIALDKLAQIHGNTIRLTGYKDPVYPIDDATPFQVSPGYVIASATAKLLGGPVENPETDPDGKFSNLQYWAMQRELERKRARTAIAPNPQFFV